MPSPVRLAALALTVAVATGLTGCGEKSSYDASEAGLRDWLVAAHLGDETACDHLTAKLRQEPSGCDLDLPALPPADADMTVSAWDPSGEAVIDVDHGPDGVSFSMQFEDDRWLVAGSAG